MKKEFLNEEMTYVAPSMKVVEMQMESAVLGGSGNVTTGNMGPEEETGGGPAIDIEH